MFNADAKRKFIDYYTDKKSTKEYCITLFEATGEYEEKWGADLCSRSVEELETMAEDIMGLRYWDRNPRIFVLNDYTRWCLDNDVPGANDNFFKINPENTEKMRRLMVANPVHLEWYLNKIFDPVSEETVDIVYRCYFWLAFFGLPEEDVFDVTAKSLDLKTASIIVNGRTYPIYREALPALKKASKLKEFVFKHPNYTGYIMKIRAAGTSLIRGMNETLQLQSFRVIISRKTKDGLEAAEGAKLTYQRTWVSGMYYRAFQKEQIGLEVDFHDLAKRQMEGKDYKVDGKTNTRRAIMLKKANNFKSDYGNWKKAFRI